MTSNSLILIHGALHTEAMWKELILHLPNTTIYSPRIGAHENYKDSINSIISKNNLDNPIIVGYSMGARIAQLLSQQINYKKLILISSSFGIKNLEERKQRLLNDQILANSFIDFKSFISKWQDQDLFLKKSFKRQTLDKETVYSHLVNLGQGTFEYQNSLPKNTTLIVGSNDLKYLELAKDYQQNPIIIKDAKHDLVLSHPKELATIIKNI